MLNIFFATFSKGSLSNKDGNGLQKRHLKNEFALPF